MTKEPESRPLRWPVVCRNFVSVHEEHLAAIEHARAIVNVGKCSEKHVVAQTNLPYDTRHEGKYSR